MSDTVIGVSLAAAASFGWSAAAMHKGATTTPADATGVLGLLRHVLRQPLWVTGMLASLTGLGLHALALRHGAITVVQPLVVQSLLFSLVFRALLEHHVLPRAVTTWALVSTAGLGLLLVASSSTPGTTRPDAAAAAVVLAVAAVVAAGCWGLARRSSPSTEGALLGAVVGIAFGLTAGALKATVGVSGIGAALRSPSLYVLIVVGVGGQLLNQIVYRRVALQASLPSVNAVNPVVALLVGAVVFGEHPPTDARDIAMELLGLAVTLVGLYRLGRIRQSG